MILVRNVFRAKFGKAGELARLMTEGIQGMSGSSGGRWRILTDLVSGPYDTVVLESEYKSLADLEEQRARMFADPEFGKGMAGTVDLIDSGHAEIYTIEAHGG